jgi:hypothetical protein
MISVGDHVLIISPNGRKVRCRAMVMGVDDGNTLILNRKLPSTVKRGDLIVTVGGSSYWQSDDLNNANLGIERKA